VISGGVIEDIGEVLFVTNVSNKVIDITTIKNIWSMKYVGDVKRKKLRLMSRAFLYVWTVMDISTDLRGLNIMKKKGSVLLRYD
tara:strand:+ start:219 stop:470 length:252 start_codon:yes stop_codon:yes gene_type:complete